MTDDPKKPVPYSTIHGVERKPEPRTVKVDAAPSWAITMQEGINANHKVVLGQMQSMERRLDDLETWRKTGKHAAVVVAEGGPKTTTSGEIRRVSENDLKQDSIIAQLLTTQAATESKVDALTTTQTTQTEKLTKLEATVGATDERKMLILEDVHKRATAFIDSPTGRLLKGLLYLAIATYATARGVHIGP